MEERTPEESLSWKAIADRLTQKIASGEWAAGSRVAPGSVLAQELGVSRNTAHRAVEELQRRGLVVRRKGSGTVVATRERPTLRRVALLMDFLAPQQNYPSADLVRGLQEGLGEGTDLIVTQNSGDLATEVRQLSSLSDEVDGIVIYPIARNDAAAAVYDGLRQRGFPIVALDRRHVNVDCDAVFTDDREGARRAVAALVGGGPRRVGFVSFRRPFFQSVHERYEGYREALLAANIQPCDEDVRWFPKDCSHDMGPFLSLVRDTMYALTRRPDPIDALFCVEDIFALSAIQACSHLGLRVPEDMEIVTFSDWPPNLLPTPWNVHRVVPRKDEIGRAAARLLQARLADPQRPSATVRVPGNFFHSGASLFEDPAPLID